MQCADVRVLQSRNGPSFPFETPSLFVRRSEHDLHGNTTVETSVACQPDLAHASGADGRYEFVRPEMRARSHH
jgi:hypothetical protein